MKTKFFVLLTACFAYYSSNAQTFSSTGGTRLVNAQEVGEPGRPNGQVRTKRAPNFFGDKAVVIDNFKKSGIPKSVIDSIINQKNFLGNGAYSKVIAGMTAVRNTSNILKNMRATAPVTAGTTIIGNLTQLNNNRARLANNTGGTFVFRNTIKVNRPILVGSNKVIWVDGVLDYTGVEAISFGGADFTPRGSKLDGVFSVRHPFNGTLRKVKSDGSSPKADRDENSRIINFSKARGKNNVLIKGTKRGRLIIRKGKERDVNNILLPKVNGVVVLGGNRVRVENLRIEGAQNGVVFWSTKDAVLKNTFINRSTYRGVHVHSSVCSNNRADAFGVVKNNFITNSDVDAIDVDSISAYWDVDDNVLVGVRNRSGLSTRFLLWTEIDAHHNNMRGNVGIFLDGNGGGFQENGTEAIRRTNNPTGFWKGTRNNAWLNNNIFYATNSRQSFTMAKSRFIIFNTITFRNNYVWALNAGIRKHNPKANVTNDVYYLTGTPPGAKNINESSDAVLNVSPNPATAGSSVQLNTNSENVDVNIYNMQGARVYSGTSSTIETLNLNPGLYIVSALVDNKAETLKLVIK